MDGWEGSLKSEISFHPSFQFTSYPYLNHNRALGVVGKSRPTNLALLTLDTKYLLCHSWYHILMILFNLVVNFSPRRVGIKGNSGNMNWVLLTHRTIDWIILVNQLIPFIESHEWIIKKKLNETFLYAFYNWSLNYFLRYQNLRKKNNQSSTTI